MAPAPGGVAERLIEPARLRPNRSMPPRRGEEMTGTRVAGLPRQHALALEKEPGTASLTAHEEGELTRSNDEATKKPWRASGCILSAQPTRAVKASPGAACGRP